MHKISLQGTPRGPVLAVMVVFNGMHYLREGIQSTLNALGPDNGLLVVDNDSTDGSYNYVREHFPQVALLQTHENLGGAGGFSAGMHVALETAGVEYLWLLDNDIVVEPGALEPLVQCLEATPQAAGAGSQICLLSEPETVQELGGTYTPWLGDIRPRRVGSPRQQHGTPEQVDYLAACSLLVRKSALREIGRFNDQFIFYDDVDWGLRAGTLGYSLWAVPQSIVRHNFSGLKPRVPWREYYRKRNRTFCLAKYPPARLGKMALLIYLCYLNYLTRVHRWLGNHDMATTYQMALEDFRSGRGGKNNVIHDMEGSNIPAPANPGSSPGTKAVTGLVKLAYLLYGLLRGTGDFITVAGKSGKTETRFLQFETVAAGSEPAR